MRQDFLKNYILNILQKKKVLKILPARWNRNKILFIQGILNKKKKKDKYIILEAVVTFD